MPSLQDVVGGVARGALERAVKALPLPVSLPEPLERASDPIRWRELAGRLVLLTRWDGAGLLGAAAVADLAAAGAEVVLLDPALPPADLARLQRPWPSGGRVHHAPCALEPEALGRALADRTRPADRGAPRRAAVVIHPVRLPGTLDGPALYAATRAEVDLLAVVGQAAARALGPGSRLLFPTVLASSAAAGARPGASAASGPDAGEPLRLALATFARSLAKEVGKRGTTVHAPALTGTDPLAAARALAWLAGPRASFLTALTLEVGSAVGARLPAPRPADDAGARRLLAGKVVVVTGAARGIGAAVALACAREGAAVGLNDLALSEKPAAETLRAVRAQGAEAAFLPFDVSTAEGARALVEAARRQWGRIDVLVNNAGITRDRTLARMQPREWQQALDVNLGAAVHLTDAARDLLAPGGAVVNLASVMGIAGNFGQTNYATAKAALLGFTRRAAVELAPRGITVNALAPGFIRTRLTAAMPAVNRLMATQLTALLQAGEPEDIAELVVFLAGPDGAAMTGQTIRVDGGMAVGA